MLLKAYTLLDTKTGIYSPPFFLQLDAMALRAVMELGMDRNTQVGKYPSDFVLYRIGEYDDNTAQFFVTPQTSLGNVAGLYAGNDVSTLVGDVAAKHS